MSPSPPAERPYLTEPSVLLRGGAAAALLILMFATSWYGLSTGAHGAFGASSSSAATAWRMLRIERWLLIAAVVTTVLSIAVADGRLADLAGVIGALATVVLFYRLLIHLPDPHAVLDVKLGGYLALLASAAMTLGAYEAPSTPPPSRGTAVLPSPAPARESPPLSRAER